MPLTWRPGITYLAHLAHLDYLVHRFPPNRSRKSPEGGNSCKLEGSEGEGTWRLPVLPPLLNSMQMSSSQIITQREKARQPPSVVVVVGGKVQEGCCHCQGLSVSWQYLLSTYSVQGTAANSGDHTCPQGATDGVQGLPSSRRGCSEPLASTGGVWLPGREALWVRGRR